MTRLWTTAQRASFALIADQLIPRHPEHLSASEAAIAERLLDQAGEVVPERMVVIERLLADHPVTSSDQAAAAVAGLRDDDPERFDAVAELIAGMYFMSTEVRRRFDYVGQEPEPARADMVDFEELLMPVFDIGREPRLAPGDGPSS